MNPAKHRQTRVSERGVAAVTRMAGCLHGLDGRVGLLLAEANHDVDEALVIKSALLGATGGLLGLLHPLNLGGLAADLAGTGETTVNLSLQQGLAGGQTTARGCAGARETGRGKGRSEHAGTRSRERINEIHLTMSSGRGGEPIGGVKARTIGRRRWGGG